MKVRTLLMVGACIAATGVSMAASAQVAVQSPIPPKDPSTPATSAAPTPDGPTAPANPNPVVESTAQQGDIVVTAQRRSESIQTVPVSVTAIGAQDLKERGINDLQQIGLVAPSLQVNNNTNFSVRGIGTLSFSTALDTSVAISLDDVNLGKPLLSAVPFYDISQIEVLNGPQGLLFGKNASAGLLNIVTTKPEIGHYGASFDMEADNRSRPGDDAQGALARVALNIPVTANSALRIAGIYNYQQPVVRFVGPTGSPLDDDLRQYGIRAKYLWEPSSGTQLYVIGEFDRSTGVAGLFDNTYRSLGANSPETGPLAAIGIVPSATNQLAAGNAPFYRNLNTGGAQATLSHTFANGMTLSDVAAWKFYKLNQQLDGDQAPGNGIDLNQTVARYNQYTNELRLTLPTGDRLSGQFGLYYFKSKIDSAFNLGGNVFFPPFLLPNFPFCVGATVRAGGPPNCSVSNVNFLGQDTTYTLNNESYAAFGQVDYRLFDGLKLVAGGRVTHDAIDIDLVQDRLPYFVPLGVPGRYVQNYKNTNFSFKVGPQYQITPTIMAYLSYGQGYKGPGFNDVPESANGSLVVRPETTKSFEGGVKSQFFDRRLTFNIALFHTKFDNYQAQSFNTQTQSFIIQNAASLTSKGIELGVIAKPVRGLVLNGNASILDTKFDSFPGAQCYIGQTSPGCATGGTFDAGGLRAPLAPKFTFSGEATYEHTLTGSLMAFIEGNYYHRSLVYYQVNHAPGAVIGGIDVLGASVGVHGENWRLSAFCKNCTNKIYPVNVSTVPFDANNGVQSYYQIFDFNSVRTIGLKMAFNF